MEIEALDSTTKHRLWFLLNTYIHHMSKTTMCSRILCARHDVVSSFSLNYDGHQDIQTRTPAQSRKAIICHQLRKKEAIALPDLNLVRTWQRFQTACLNLMKGRRKIKWIHPLTWNNLLHNESTNYLCSSMFKSRDSSLKTTTNL